MYGLRDSLGWLTYDVPTTRKITITSSTKDALKFKTFDEALDWLHSCGLQYFCIIKIGEK